LAALAKRFFAVENIATVDFGVGDGKEFFELAGVETAGMFLLLEIEQTGAQRVVGSGVTALLHLSIEELLGFWAE
jgi:hypothetical protein